MNNQNLQAPTWTLIAPNDTVDQVPTLRGFEVWSAGDVKWSDITGFDQTHTFAAPFPVRIVGQVKRIWSTGTTVTSPTVNIVGLR